MYRAAVLISLLCVPVPASLAASPAASSRQEEDEKPDKRPEIKELLDKLGDHIKKRGKEDVEAIQLIDTAFLKEFPESGEKDRKSIVKGLSSCLKVKRQEDEDGVRDNKLYIAAAVALGKMGPESSKELMSWIDHKSHRKDVTLQRYLILSLGKTKDEKGIKTLIGMLDNPRPAVVGAAAEALANYNELELDDRKDIFKELLKVLMSAFNNAESNFNDPIAQERIDIIKAPAVTTLQVLSGHDERDPTEWQRWWNKNKKKDWDEE